MTSTWYELSDNPDGIKSYFDDPPPLDAVDIREFEGSGYFDQQSFRLWCDLPRSPESMPPGSILSLALSFHHLTTATISLAPDVQGTCLGFSRTCEGLIRVTGRGATNLALTCKHFMIESVVQSHPDEREKHRRDLSSYHQLWNSCLIELADLGYELSLRGKPDADRRTSNCVYSAVIDSVHLNAPNPVGLLGLATIHLRFPEFDHQSQIWQRSGPNLILELMTAWEKSWRKPDP